ncbi:hypothetical protein M409DRAFT_16687 [Zasmidium cellare ATCC 36951]|uniref:Uncharacterized protein n=1 Tax=Zasmidium cellare ATCC 36951 TaxID=1080233 RepID=A0A6A6D4Z8_ZASCE|nr:uncharacterized protein M409DRAFT_16687 [Zasmidium cellare ATCC 36951]KAF2172726.1 hypothetical protein M409DRAFT_16687 [Zasmidium cellare ATCC 36951]
MKSFTATLSPLLALSSATLSAAYDHAQLNGMTVFGYQAWYPTWDPNHQPQDQVHSNDFKWFNPAQGTPGPPNPPNSQVLTDTLPYVEDYPSECWETTNFILANGSHAQFFNSYCTAVIEKHFQYMVQYGIDGVFVQRFFDAATPSNDYYNATLQALQTIQQMAEKYNKYFAVEYDLSGKTDAWGPDQYLTILQNDYNNVVKPLFSSKSYIYNGTRPVVEIWGVAINNGTGPNGSKFKDIINRFQEAPENPFMVAGVPHNWLDYKTRDPNGYWPAFQQADCIQPWPVGAFSTISDFQWSVQHELLPGKAQTDSWGIKFGGAFTPGGSNRNANTNATYQPPLGSRFNGTFYEEQLKSFSNGTVKAWFNFGAMFDEYTEGKPAIQPPSFKNLPTNPNPGFLGSDDDKSPFYYMQLSGQYTTENHQLWGQQPL